MEAAATQVVVTTKKATKSHRSTAGKIAAQATKNAPDEASAAAAIAKAYADRYTMAPVEDLVEEVPVEEVPRTPVHTQISKAEKQARIAALLAHAARVMQPGSSKHAPASTPQMVGTSTPQGQANAAIAQDRVLMVDPLQGRDDATAHRLGNADKSKFFQAADKQQAAAMDRDLKQWQAREAGKGAPEMALYDPGLAMDSLSEDSMLDAAAMGAGAAVNTGMFVLLGDMWKNHSGPNKAGDPPPAMKHLSCDACRMLLDNGCTRSGASLPAHPTCRFAGSSKAAKPRAWMWPRKPQHSAVQPPRLGNRRS